MKRIITEVSTKDYLQGAVNQATIKQGSWVRYVLHGRPILAEVQYIYRAEIYMDVRVITDLGEVQASEILEVRNS